MKRGLTLAALFVLSLGGSREVTAKLPDPISDLMIQTNSVDGKPDEIGTFSDSGVDFPKYDDLVAQMQELARRHPDLAEWVSYGKTVGGRSLSMLRIESKAADLTHLGRPAIEISGAIHGNEYLGIEEPLLEAFLDKPETVPSLKLYLAVGGVIYYIPVINPDGFEDRQRANGHDKDLNRDWDVPPTQLHLFTEPESTALAKYLDSDLSAHGLKYVFSLDYHCCLGAMITPWTYINSYPSQNDMVKYNEFAQIQKVALGFDVGNAMDTVGYNAVGGTIDYFFSKYGTTAFAIEGRQGGEYDSLDKHLKFFDGVFNKVAAASLLGE